MPGAVNTRQTRITRRTRQEKIVSLGFNSVVLIVENAAAGLQAQPCIAAKKEENEAKKAKNAEFDTV